MNDGIKFCVYITPCGYCTKFDKWCEKKYKNKENNNCNLEKFIESCNKSAKLIMEDV